MSIENVTTNRSATRRPLPTGRRVARAAAVVAALALGVGGLMPVQAAAADVGLPQFGYGGEVTVADDLDYAPTGEFIFPSVFHAGEHLVDPLGEWYLYYAPHENPGGISFVYADSLAGPWTEYDANPVVSNVWAPNYSVPHVSSPEAVWNEQEQQMFLYFHGDNTTTRYATSSDGATFEYGGVAVTTAMTGPDATEASYARVFEHPDPSSPYAYGMFFMENTTQNIRRIRVAESVDGRSWSVRPSPILTPIAGETNVSGANLLERGGQYYITYHASDGVSYARTIDPALTTVGDRQVLHRSSGLGDDVGRVAAPEIVVDGDRSYLFYESGARLEATIRWAVTDGVS